MDPRRDSLLVGPKRRHTDLPPVRSSGGSIRIPSSVCAPATVRVARGGHGRRQARSDPPLLAAADTITD